ncbi:MAG: hypothetical protein IJT07_01410 [Oscillospiraceae bacterium]|nr:hypothetical protein [Oscillospiraceae bacterium]
MKRMGKRILCMMLAALMLLSLAACGEPKQPEATTDETSEVGAAFVGTWVCDRATLEIAKEGEAFNCHIHWGSSYAEAAEWDYTCTYDEAANALVGTGTRKTVVYADNGDVASSVEEYADGAVQFTLLENGNLVWQDAKEDAGKDMQFERVSFVGEVPTQEAFVNDYFHVIGGFLQGTSGSSLAMAQAACEAFRFAVINRMDIVDVPTLRDTMLAAWESMTDEERAAFDANFIDVVQLVDACLADWEGARGTFEDAGVAEDMAALLADPTAQEAWKTLVAHTLTMGNYDGE